MEPKDRRSLKGLPSWLPKIVMLVGGSWPTRTLHPRPPSSVLTTAISLASNANCPVPGCPFDTVSDSMSETSAGIRVASPWVRRYPRRGDAGRFRRSGTRCAGAPRLYAMDSMAAHSEGYSPRCSRTIRTARSRTLGENWFDFLLVALSFQGKEPHQNPGRFKKSDVLIVSENKQNVSTLAPGGSAAHCSRTKADPGRDSCAGCIR